MKRIETTTLLAVLVSLSGCAVASYLRPPTVDEVNDLVSRQEFGEALAELQDISDSHPDREMYRELETEVRALADDYAATVISRTELMESEEDWTGAVAVLLESRRKYPSSEALQIAEEQMLQRQSLRLSALDDDLLLIRAQRLLMELPLRQEIARVDPYSLEARRQVEAIGVELVSLTEQLTVAGERTLQEGDLASAEAFLTTARRIESSERVEVGLTRISTVLDSLAAAEQERLRQIDEAAARAREAAAAEEAQRLRAERDRQLNNMVQEIVDALDQQQLLESRRLIERARRIRPDAQEIVELTQQLDEKISRQVDRFLAEGNELYRGGSFERAKQLWETALELDPENVAVRAQVERVDRVLASIQELQNRKIGRPPPPPPPG